MDKKALAEMNASGVAPCGCERVHNEQGAAVLHDEACRATQAKATEKAVTTAQAEVQRKQEVSQILASLKPSDLKRLLSAKAEPVAKAEKAEPVRPPTSGTSAQSSSTGSDQRSGTGTSSATPGASSRSGGLGTV